MRIDLPPDWVVAVGGWALLIGAFVLGPWSISQPMSGDEAQQFMRTSCANSLGILESIEASCTHSTPDLALNDRLCAGRPAGFVVAHLLYVSAFRRP